MRSKQYFTSIKNNPHEISTDPIYEVDEKVDLISGLKKSTF